MADNPIKQKIILEGEKQYRDAIRDAQRNLKTLRSELKAETAELGANATAQEKNAAKIKSLKQQIKEQEKIVNANKEALKEVKEKYADNADAIAKYEQKLNDSRTALANMKNELDSVGQGFKGVEVNAAQATVASKSVADTLGSIADVGDSVSSALESVFMGLMETVRDVAREIWDLIAETAAKADRWGDLAGFYGSTAEEVQKVNTSIDAAGANFEDFVSLMNTLQFKGKDKKLVEWLGLSDVNYDNEVQHTMAALEALNKKKKELGTGKFNEQLAEVFGGKSSGFLQLVDKYDKIIEKSKELEENGYLMNGEGIETFASINDTIASITEKWEALKSKVAEGLGQSTLDIMTHVEGGLDALARYFNAETPEERQQALDDLEKQLTEACKSIAKAIEDGISTLTEVSRNLQESEDPIVSTIGNILGGLASALEWLTEDNAQNFKNALLILAGAWGAAEVLKMIGVIGSLAQSLATLKMAGGLGALTNLIAGNGLGAAGTAAGSSWGLAFGTAAMKASPFLTWLFNFIGGGTGSVVTGASSVFGPIADWLTHESPIAPVLNGTQSLPEFVEETKENIEKNAETFEEDWKNNGLVKGAEWLFNNWKKNGEQTAEYWEGIHKQQQEASEWILPDDATAEEARAFVEAMQKVEEIVEDVDLDSQHTDQEKNDALQDWWDSWREGAEDEDNNLEWVKEVFGDDFGTVWDTIMRRLDELGEKQMDLEDLPAEWWQTQGGNAGNQDGMTGQDARTMTQAVNNMPSAVAKSIGGIKVIMDGRTVGNLILPYVSEGIARGVI